MSGLELDFETKSDVDLKKRGAYNYFASPLTEPLMASYSINGNPVKRWRPPAPCPPDIVAHLEAGGGISAHNASFERLAIQMVLTPRYGWPATRIEQYRCTAATAAAMSLPRDLAGVGSALNLPIQKNKEGGALIRKFSIPRRITKADKCRHCEGGYVSTGCEHSDDTVDNYVPCKHCGATGLNPGPLWNDPKDFPVEFERFHDYCDDDVRTEALADRRMVPLSTYEQEMYWIDQRINDRGIRIDRKSARAALALADKAKRKLDAEMRIATGGYVKACSQPGKLVEWVVSQGVPMTSATKAEIEELLELDDLPSHVRHAIELRQEAAKTSVSKLSSFLARASADGRIRGAFLYHAASTGRWSSVGAQLHNLPRPRKEFGDAHLDLAALFEAFRHEDPDRLKLLYGDVLGRPLWLISDAIRGFLWAAPNHDLLAADYAGIEGAVAAWFADEHWKVEAMFALIADPSLPDMYMRAAGGILGKPPETINKSERQALGKISELSLQFQGGPGAFRSMARNYSMKLAPLYPIVWVAASGERREKATKRYDNAVKRNEPISNLLTREEFLAAEVVKIGWRETHPAISATWGELEDAMRQAVDSPGQKIRVKKVEYLVARGFLWCRLPSGRCLAYGAPRIKQQVWAKPLLEDGTFGESEVMGREEARALANRGKVQIEREAKSAVTALGVNSVTKKWERFALYGGLAFENIVQAIARDILAHGIRQAEDAGYPVIGHVHDEIITEVPKDFGDVGQFEQLICELPEWAKGLPLTASGWRGKRYRKD